MKKSIGYILVFFILASACKKRVEIIEITTEKIKSWTEIKRFTGTEKIFLSSGSSANAIYLQQPFFFTKIRNQNINNGITVFGAYLPTNVWIKIPIASNFFAYPYSDSAINIKSNLDPISTPSGGYFNLKQIDHSLVKIKTDYSELFKCMAITKNGVLLLSYQNNQSLSPLTFMVMKINIFPINPYADTQYTKKITIPRTSIDGNVRYIAAVKDYFLANLSGNGIYKIYEDGSFKKVYTPISVNAFYHWNGKIYAHAEGNRLLISSNNAEDWQEYNGISNTMIFSNYYTIKDSLIGVYRDNIYTLKWDGLNYTERFLKNDALEDTRINGIEILNDTVYVATTSGLFVKKYSSFFDGK